MSNQRRTQTDFSGAPAPARQDGSSQAGSSQAGPSQAGPSQVIPDNIRRVGRYEVDALLGSGGMGTVYGARVDGPGKARKRVALKLLHAHFCEDARFVEMFLNEMRLAMAMAHRNIVQTFDAGLDDGRYYMVMELVGGCSLRELLSRLPTYNWLPLPMALFIARELSEALAYAHEQELDLTGQSGGIIHQDVCPNNVLLSREGDVKLADFGVSRAARFIDPAVERGIQGKPGYMAPEQARGAPEPRSDLYALGAVLFELVFARRFRSQRTLDAARDGDREATPLNEPDVPAALVSLIEHCTAPDPEARPASARKITRTLDRLLASMRAATTADLDARTSLGGFVSSHLGPNKDGSLPAIVLPRDDDPRAAEVARLLDAPTLSTPSDPPGRPETLTDPPLTATPMAPRHGRRIAGGLGVLALLAVAIALLWLVIPDPSPPAIALSRVDASVAVDAALASDSLADSRHAGDFAPPLGEDAASPSTSPKRKRPLRRKRRRGVALLDLNAIPWAVVYVDGRKRGTTPIQGLRLKAGLRRIRLVNPVLKTRKSLRLRLRPGQRLRRVVVMRR